MTPKSEALRRLRESERLRQPRLQRILALLDGASGRTRIVGGVVRDTLLGLPAATDIDLATELLPAEVQARAEQANIKSIPTGVEFGTVTVVDGPLSCEVTTLRKDIRTDGRHAIVSFGTDWVEDASRRDFTLNALYADQSGNLFDPLNGLDDCLSGHVRFIGDPESRIAEDRLRVYRFFRFSASHGNQTLDKKGLDACSAAVGTLANLSAERVGSEMMRMLALPAIASTLATMTQLHILDLQETALVNLERLEALGASEPHQRLALIGPVTGGGNTQDIWRLSNADMAKAREIGDAAALIAGNRISEAVYRFAGTIGSAIPVAAARAGHSLVWCNRAADRAAAINPPPFPLNGNDLVAIGIQPGKELGAQLAEMERIWIESDFTLDRRQLLARLR